MGAEELIKILESLKKTAGFSVTQRIKQVKQPRGGYINPRTMNVVELGGGIDELNPEENVHASLVGLAVDYLTRFMSGSSVEESFKISMMGAEVIKEEKTARKVMTGIKGLDEKSIINAIKISGFDVCYRANIMGYRPVDEIKPDKETIENIRTMVERSLKFFEQYGPKVLDGFTFEGGYTDMVRSGDGDFTTKDTLWDFKVSKTKPKKEHTLQLLMYWRMGLHSVHSEFKSVKYLGIYNPRLNVVYQLDVNDISDELISEIEKEVIGYKD